MASSLHYPSTHVHSTSAHPLGPAQLASGPPPKLFLTTGHYVNIPTSLSPWSRGNSAHKERDGLQSWPALDAGSSQTGAGRRIGKLWSSPGAMESVHDLRVSGMEFLRGHFTKWSEGQVVLSRGWSRPKLQNVQGHHGVGGAGLGVLPAERRGGKHGPLHGRILCLLALANPILKSLPWTWMDVSNRSVSDPFTPRVPKPQRKKVREFGFRHGWVQDRHIPHHVSLSFSVSCSPSLGPLSSEGLPERDFRRQLG